MRKDKGSAKRGVDPRLARACSMRVCCFGLMLRRDKGHRLLGEWIRVAFMSSLLEPDSTRLKIEYAEKN